MKDQTHCILLSSLMLVCSAAAAQSSPASLDFDKTFNATNSTPFMHFRAEYMSTGTGHQLEVWRDHDRRLKRRTDDAVESFVTKTSDDPEWSMVILDLRRKIRTDIDRTNLYRVGHFVDWFGMAHGLSRPPGAYDLRLSAAVQGAPKTIAPCRWYRLSSQGRDSDICWSSAMKLPLVIATAQGQVQWQVLQVDTRAPVSETFRVKDEGFARNNANADIDTD